MGVRMSGLPSCASIDPSTYSTSEWMTLSGCTTTSIRSARHAKQPVRFDHLETLVHHGRGVYADLAPHHPIRMGTGFVRRHPRKFRERPLPERTAGGGEQDAADAGRPGVPRVARRKALEDRVVLAVDRQQRRAARCAAPMNAAPPMTSASLLASRMRLPARAAASVGRRPAAPTIAATTVSAPGSVAASTSPASPRARASAGPRPRAPARALRAASGSNSAATPVDGAGRGGQASPIGGAR